MPIITKKELNFFKAKENNKFDISTVKKKTIAKTFARPSKGSCNYSKVEPDD